MGKKIRAYHFMPLLDERNINDQGIDANAIVAENTAHPWRALVVSDTAGPDEPGRYAVSTNDEDVYFASEAHAKAGTSPLDRNGDSVTLEGGITILAAHRLGGNLYGSSKDIGTINAKIPHLSETGGRVNRVGFSRVQLEGTFEKMGFFHEFTAESFIFDTMDDLYGHLSRELIRGADEITEDMLQIDLLTNAGVNRYAGVATAIDELTGEGATPSVVEYEDLVRLDIDLDNNRSPKTTKMITGSRMQDTTVLRHGRVLFCGSELIPTIMKMTDSFGNPAFVGVEHYAYSGDYRTGVDLLFGEIGKVGNFRIIVNPEMQHFAGRGETSTAANLGYRTSTIGDGTEKYDVFPMLHIGSEAFTTIGFQTSGGMVKFQITTKMPGRETADWHDPYGETGFSSIKWWYGFMILRAERLAVVYSVAEE